MTVLLVAIYLAGRHITMPGLDPTITARVSASSRLGPELFTAFALGVTPLYSTLILFEIVKLGMPALKRWHEETGLRIPRPLLIISLLLAAFQAIGVCKGMTQIPGLVTLPATSFLVIGVATMVAATALLAWFINLISARGIGDGFLLLLVTPTLVHSAIQLPMFFAAWWSGMPETDAMTSLGYILLATVLLLFAQVKQERASSHPDAIARHAATDVWPPLLASLLAGVALVPLVLLPTGLTAADYAAFGPGGMVHMALVPCLIALFTLLRPDDRGTPWIVALCQMLICISGELLLRFGKLPLAIDPSFLILIVGTIIQFAASTRMALRTMRDQGPETVQTA